MLGGASSFFGGAVSAVDNDLMTMSSNTDTSESLSKNKQQKVDSNYSEPITVERDMSKESSISSASCDAQLLTTSKSYLFDSIKGSPSCLDGIFIILIEIFVELHHKNYFQE